MPITTVNTFNGGMSADARSSASYSQLCKHFDNFTAKHKLTPYRSSEDAYVSQTTFQGQNFLMYGGNMYVLGRQAAVNRALILKNSDLATPSWSSPTNGDDPTYTIPAGAQVFFVEYQGLIWGANSNGLWSYNIAGTTFTAGAQALTYTYITQGLVHSKDSKLYVGYTNATASYIAVKSGAGAWNITALTITNNISHKIVSLCEYGNYIAIGFAPLEVGKSSFVILWDKDSTLADVSESLDLGSQVLFALENIDGYLIAVSASANTSAVLYPKLIFLKYGGGSFQVFRELLLSSGVNSIIGKQKINNRLYFCLNASSFNYTTQYDYTGLWSVGRTGENEPFSVSFTQVPDNNTLPQDMKGFILVENYFYISYRDSGTGDYGMSKTDDQNNFTATSVYRTVVNPNMNEVDKIVKKQLISVVLSYEKLPTNGQVVLKYKVDGATSFTTIFTETTDNAIATEASNGSDGVPFSEGRDYEFQIESTGGCEITGLLYKYEVLDTLL